MAAEIDPLPSPRDLLSALLKDADLNPHADILVAGPSAFAALIWLCRHGFETVAYVRPGVRVSGDALLVLHPVPTAELAAILKDAAVNEGGLVVVKTASIPPAEGEPSMREFFERHGLTLERRIERGSFAIHLARRQAREALGRAA